ncbi:glycoside hydrolase family 32 protein [Haloferula sargassicola]|uniref:Fructan beta-fructosidase n=1 Tax=Haloferula sargassicola TaxID=490096 RepID=A0ABP9UP83_9BACT
MLSPIEIFRPVSAMLVAAAPLHAAATPLFPNSDFESGTLEHWTAVGDAFDNAQPTLGDNPIERGRESAFPQGERWIGTFEFHDGEQGNPGAARGDAATGTLTSEPFVINRRYIAFRIGGGRLPAEVGVKLECEGEDYFMATGNDSEAMVPVSFDAVALMGKTARIVVFDEAVGGWGHVNVDDFRASDEELPGEDGGFEITPGLPVADLPAVGYTQDLRPQFHFSSRRHWLNDPNGMVFDGEAYHLFFQHNPIGTGWGNMTWGHAISPDMVHWRQLPHALLPYQVDGQYGTIYSGTAVVDLHNSLGVQQGERKTLVAFFTFAGMRDPFYQAMAYSTDGGVTWTYWNHGRAVVPNQGFDVGERDPKVFWHEQSQQWVMALWVERSPGRVRFFTSPNLTDWTFASDLRRDWAFECMDLVALPVDGDPGRTKWLIYDASFDYEIGTFDGTSFTTELGPFHAGRGNFYAAQTFNQAPGGRVVQIGWMANGPDSAAAYGLPYNQQMSFPCDLSLRTTPEGIRLCATPAVEIDGLVTTTFEPEATVLEPGMNLLSGAGDLDLMDLSIEFSPGQAQALVMDLPRTSIRYQRESGQLTFVDAGGNVSELVDGPVMPRDGKVRLRLLLDRLSVEAYVFDGERFGSHYVGPDHGTETPSIHAVGGNVQVSALSVKSLDSAWNSQAGLAGALANPDFEEGLPLAGATRPTVAEWGSFGAWDEAVELLDDSGDAFSESAGYPAFHGLGAVALRTREADNPPTAGIYQSLGVIGLEDVGKTLTAGAQFGARIPTEAGGASQTGELTISFRKGVNGGLAGNRGTLLGEAASRVITSRSGDPPTLETAGFSPRSASFTPAAADLGTEVFLVLDLARMSTSPPAAMMELLVDDVALSTGSPLPFSGPMAYEPFDYPSGSAALSGKDGGTGWLGPWELVDHGSADLVADSLDAAAVSPEGYAEESQGQHSDLPNGRRVGRWLDTRPVGPFGLAGYLDDRGCIGADGKTLYVSFLQQPNGTSLFYEFEFHRDHLGDPGRIAGVGNDRSGDDVHLRLPNGGQPVIGPGNTAVNLYVVRIDFKPGGDDVRVYRNPTDLSEPAVATLEMADVGDLSFNGLSFGAFVNGRSVAHDEVRLSATWQQALAIDPYLSWEATVDLRGADSGFNQDPDGDGVPNGLEWLLGGDPRQADAPSPEVREPGSGLVLDFQLRALPLEGDELVLEWSDDLAGPWHAIPISRGMGTYLGGITLSVEGSSPPFEVTVRLEKSARCRFVRLAVRRAG